MPIQHQAPSWRLIARGILCATIRDVKRKPGENGQAEWGKQENNSTRLAFVLQVDCSMQEQLARRKDSVECRALCAEHAPKRPIVCPETPQKPGVNPALLCYPPALRLRAIEDFSAFGV
jgi:hypothetical protein